MRRILLIGQVVRASRRRRPAILAKFAAATANGKRCIVPGSRAAVAAFVAALEKRSAPPG